MRSQVPKYALRVLRGLCDERYLEEVEGDLEEIYEHNLKTFGKKKAKKLYWFDVLKHIRPYFIKKRSINLLTQNQTAMWTIYLKIALRNFWKSKVISAINTTGLSLGLACCIIIFFHIKDEWSYDRFLENGDSIYRVVVVYPEEADPYSAGGPIPLGPTLKSDFAGISDAVRLWRDYQPTLLKGEQVFRENNLIFTDQTFFEMFSFKLRKGNPSTALSKPNTIILTERMAKKYFGDEDPMGKILEYRGGRGELQFIVTGVMDDLPHNTHMSFDFLASFLSVTGNEDSWGSFKPIWTYITLKEGVSTDDIQAGLPEFAKKYVPYRVKESPGFRFELEQMSQIYMHSMARRNMKPLGDVQTIYILTIVGISILLIACINFINLSMANSLVRFKEVGIRKVMGAAKSQLVRQFLVESGLTIIIALAVSVLLVAMFLPAYNNFAGKEVNFSYLMDVKFISIVLSALMGIILIAGLYPARFIAGFNQQLVLNRASDKVGSNSGIRKVFVVFQFLVSATLIIGILIIKEQQQYIQDKPLGIDKENVLVIPVSRNEDAFLQQLDAMPAVKSYGISQRLPVNLLNYDGRSFFVEGSERAVDAQSCIIDHDFVETYDIQIIDGRNHFKESTNKWEFLINESAVKSFGWETSGNALGKNIYLDRGDEIIGKVIGVFRDYHLESLHEEIPPMIMFKNIKPEWSWWGREYISLKFATNDLVSFTSQIEDLWKEHNEGRAYFSLFIDDSYDDLHEADYRFATLFNYVTIIAMFIACMGLLGLSMLIVNQKVKEIGIRKVLGASVLNVIALFSKKFIYLVLIGLVLACPLAYYLMDIWLDGFSYRINIGLKPFVLSLFFITIATIFTIIIHTSKAALTNPAETLKDE